MANINVKVGYTVDKTGLNEIKKQLTDIRLEAAQAKLSGTLTKDLETASNAASQLEDILNSAWSNKLGQLDLSKVNTGIKNTYGNVQNLQKALIQSGASGAAAYNNFAMSVLNTNVQLKQTSKTLDNMAITLKNTIRYGISSSIFNNLTNSVQKAYNYTKQLDTSLNDIRIVTGKSADEMNRFAVQANKVAKDLGKSTKDFTEASLIYYQQGLGNEEAQARAEVTLKAANVTGQAGREVSEQLTAVWNGYKVTAEEAELYVDKLAAVAASTASDLEELSTGMSKVASAAAIMGVDVDQLNAQLATIVSVTRQAPESVGTALKTIYARMGDIEAGLDSEVSLGTYTAEMAEMGVNILDANNNLRDMGEVIEEIGAKWTTMSREQQIALSQTMAGTRQYNNLLSLFDNWDMYTEALKTSANAAGTLQKQQDIYMQSTEAHLQKLSTEAERTYDILFDQDTVNGFADALTNVLGLFNNLLAGLGGGTNDFIFFGATIANIFNKQIGGAIKRQIENIEAMKANASREEIQRQIIDAHAARGQGVTNAEALEKEIPYAEKTLELQKYLTKEQAKQFTDEQAQIGLLEQRIQGILQYQDIAKKYIKTVKDGGKATIEDFEIEIEKQSELQTIETKRFKNLKKNFADYQEGVEHAFETTEQQDEITLELIDDIEKMSTYKTNEVEMSKITSKIAEGEKLTEEEISFILDSQKATRDSINQTVNDLKIGAQGIADEESGILIDLQNEQLLREQNLQAMQQQVERQKAISQAVQGMTALITVATAFSGIIKTLNNEDLTVGDKLMQIGSVLLTTLPIILINFSSIMTILPNLITMFTGLSVAEFIASTGATTLGAAIWTALAPILPIILAVGAAIALLTVGVIALVNAWNADANAAANAAEQARILTKRYQELDEAAKQLKEDISDYSEAITSLEELTKGTNEYAEALENANEKAKEMIETYGLFDDYKIEDGLIKINEDALEKAQKTANERALQAETEMYNARINANQKRAESDATNLSRKIGSKVGTGVYDDYGREFTREFSKDELKQTADALNKVREASEEEYETAMLSNDGFKKLLTTIDGVPQSVLDNIDAIADNKDALKTFTDSLNEAAAANKYYAEQIMQNMVEEQYGPQIAEMAKDKEGNVNQARYNQIIASLTASSESNVKKMQKELENISTKGSGSNNKLNKNFGYNIKNDEDLARTYAREVLGYSDQEAKDFTYKGGINKGTLKTASGEKILDEYSDDKMREQLARVAREKEIKKKYGDLIDSQSQIDAINDLMAGAQKAGEKYGTDFTDALLNSLTDADKKIDLSSLFSEIDPHEYEELSKMNTQDILDTFGLTEEQLKNAGYSSAEDFASSFKAGLDNYEWDVDKALDTAVSKKAGDLEKYDLDSDELTNYAKQLMSVAKETKNLSDELEVNADAGVVVAESVMRMNDGIDKLADGFEDWSDVLKKSSRFSEEYAEALDGMRDALSDIIGVEKDFISESFITDYLKEIEKAAKGDEKAIDSLKNALTEDIILKVSAENDLSPETIQGLLGKIQELQNEIPNIKVGTEIDVNDEQYADFFQKMQDIVNTAGLTAEQANALFSTMGFETEFVTEQKPVKKTGYGTRTVTEMKGEQSVTMPDGSTMTIPAGWETKTYPGEAYEYVDYVDAIAMSTDGKTPQIKSITKKATSSMNNYSSLNKGGKSPGSKSSGSKSEPKKVDLIEDEADRYHQVNTQITKVDNSLKKLQSQQDKLVGSKLLDNLNQQWELLNTQVKNYNEKLRIAQDEQAELRAQLASKGVQFNADGTIANYMAAFQAQENYVNSLIAQYNALSKTQQEAWDNAGTLDKAKDDFSKFKENLDRYDELVSDFIPGLQQSIQDAVDEQIDIQIQKFNYEIELRLDLAEAERDWNEFKKKIIDGIKDDDILGNAMARLVDFSSYYKEDETGIVQALRRQIDDTLAELSKMDNTGWSDVYGDNRTRALEDLKNYYDELSSNLMDILELQEEIHQSYIDMMDEAQEKFDEQVETYEMITDLIEHDMDLITMVYGEEAYSRLAKYYDKQEENYNKQLNFQRQQVDFWRAQMDALEEGSDAWDEAKKKWMDAITEWNDLVESSIENLQDKFLNAINLIFQELNNKVTGNLGLDYVNEQWNLINQNADQYLDTINSLYEVQKLESKYLDAIDKTDNVAAQRQLKEIMDAELADLRERDKLTEYDIERANRKYEIALKQIALQEAQQNKNKMRLRRDSQGNYRYEYVADGDQVGQLQDELGDMYNSLYNFDKARYQDNLNQLYSVWVEFQQKMAEAAQINDPVARAEREALLQEQYEKLINGLVEQNTTVRNNLHESAFEDLSRLYDVNIDNFWNMTEEEKEALMSDLLPYWDSGIQHMADTFAGEGGFLGVCQDAFDKLYDATKEYEDALDDLQETGRLDFESLSEGIDEVIDYTQELLSDNDELIQSYEDQLTAIGNVINELDGLVAKYKEAEEAAKAATKAAYEYWYQQNRDAASAASKDTGSTGAGNPSSNSNNNNNNSGVSATSGGGSGSGDGILSVGDTATYSGSYYNDSYGSGPSGSKYSGVANGIVIDRVTNNPYGIHIHSADGKYKDLGWVKKSQLSGYDTGGYTGEWGDNNGRLALLHQKELVLNAQDTQNILNAVNIMRGLSAAMLNRLASISANGNTGTLDSTLEQDVHIEATFPNVTSSREIEDALNNLVNMASMRANKR